MKYREDLKIVQLVNSCFYYVVLSKEMLCEKKQLLLRYSGLLIFQDGSHRPFWICYTRV